jgi:hypothetical protein
MALRIKQIKDAGSVAYYVRVLADRRSRRSPIGKDAEMHRS